MIWSLRRIVSPTVLWIAVGHVGVVLLTFAVAMAQVPPAARADLAPTGKLRAGVNYGNFILAVKDPATGDSRGPGPGGLRALPEPRPEARPARPGVQRRRGHRAVHHGKGGSARGIEARAHRACRETPGIPYPRRPVLRRAAGRRCSQGSRGGRPVLARLRRGSQGLGAGGSSDRADGRARRVGGAESARSIAHRL